MFQKIVLILLLSAIAMAQRPYYAGLSAKGRPEVASRFRDPNESTSTTVGLNNRVGESGSTEKIPVDALGDADLVHRLNQWPRENRPFWLLNADHIEAAKNPTQDAQNVQSRSNFDFDSGFEQETRPIRPSQPRSSFLGGL